MPRVNASRISTGSILPEHMTRMTRMFGGYWNLETPARSAPAYEHQLHRKATNLGSNAFDMFKPPNVTFVVLTQRQLLKKSGYLLIPKLLRSTRKELKKLLTRKLVPLFDVD